MTVQGNGARGFRVPPLQITGKGDAMRKVLLGILGLLALSAAPLAAQAEMPGEKCELERLGTTKRATDDQNIIACLKTGEKAQDGKEIAEWKAMTSSGGGGITGGCFLIGFVQTTKGAAAAVVERWGQGCKPDDYAGHIYLNGPGVATCGRAAVSGYSCGMTFADESPSVACTCLKK